MSDDLPPHVLKAIEDYRNLLLSGTDYRPFTEPPPRTEKPTLTKRAAGLLREIFSQGKVAP